LSPDRDSFDPDREGSAQEARRAARPYSIVVGLVFLGAVILAGVNSLSNEGRAVRGLEDGDPLPRFAAPSALSGINRDANIHQDDANASGDHRTAACDVPGSRRDVIRVPCDFFDRPLVMVAWFTRGCGNCRSQLDTIERVRKMFPDVAFIGLDIVDSLSNARKQVVQHGWRFPMAVDRDGAVSGLYGVGVGPTTFFAYPGGIAMDTVFGELDTNELITHVRDLVTSSRRREFG
jgi:thiol-disulfide isomerase/thioredoxin